MTGERLRPIFGNERTNLSRPSSGSYVYSYV